jgi:hypothetical protein
MPHAAQSRVSESAPRQQHRPSKTHGLAVSPGA